MTLALALSLALVLRPTPSLRRIPQGQRGACEREKGPPGARPEGPSFRERRPGYCFFSAFLAGAAAAAFFGSPAGGSTWLPCSSMLEKKTA